MRRRSALAVALLGLTAVLSACRDEDAPIEESSSLSPGDRYVALGDSYTAAPGIGRADSDDGCFRSKNNYPHLVAEKLRLELVDVSCSGAATTSITGPQLNLIGDTMPPQVDEIDSDTDLVTVRIGGNDFGLYSVVSTICVAMAERNPTGSPCTRANRKAGELAVSSKLDMLPDRVAEVLAAIEERAPLAQIIVVGYPAFAPAKEPCALFPLAEGDVRLAHRINLGLNEALATAAEDAGLPYLDVYAETRRHDICSDDPWIAGEEAIGDRAAPWHPFFEEQDLAAEMILEAIDRA